VGVEGDGISTVRELVDRERATPRQRRAERVQGKVHYQLDGEALLMLDREGLTPESVPVAGQRVTLRRRRNASSGADQFSIDPGHVHPDNLALAVRAAELVHLDFAGVDFLSPDISRSWRETGALICEVNIRPGIGLRTTPRVYVEILERMFAEGSRIPAYLLLTEGEVPPEATSARSLYDKLGCNGLSCAETIRIDNEALPDRPADSFRAAQILLGESRVNSALCVMSARMLAKTGLPIDRFDTIFVERPGPLAERLIPVMSPNAGRIEVLDHGN
jgi:cyanophycin synthetase